MVAWLFLAALTEAAVLLKTTSANDAAMDKNRPVTKVINLIKDMLETLEDEAKEDEEVYEKVACWCETNDKEKTTAIAEQEAHITDLTSAIEEATALSAKLNTEIKNLEHEVAKNQEALDKATKMRQKELAEFNEEEKDVLQSIGALKSAIIVLSKHNSFLQVPEGSLLQIAAMMKWQFHKHAHQLKFVTKQQQDDITSFLQGDTTDLSLSFKESYAPQSGAIFGILKQMKESFETNLANSQKEEMQAQAAYQDLKAAKESEIKAGTELMETKEQELADTDQKLSEDKEDLEATRDSLTADQKFLMNLKETCQNTDQEYEERVKARQEEIKGCSEALAILSSDDAHDTFTSTFNFVQSRMTLQSRKRDEAAKVLREAGHKLNSPSLIRLAARARLDAFTKVKAAIDEMITALLQEKKDEIKHKDFCTEGLNTNERETELKQRDIDKLDATLEELAAKLDTLTKELATLEAEIAEMQTQMKRAGEDREMENNDFQKTVADQRATKELLNKALDVLKKVFDKKFIQLNAKTRQEPAGPPPPPGFKEYKQSSGSGGVMGMIEQIIRDTEKLEAEAIKAETDAQKAYESFVKDTNASIEEKTRQITEKTSEKAEAEEDKTATSEGKDTAMSEMQQLSNENADLHKACDFTLKNFDIRQEARDQEVEALRQAKAILSGAK
jgi:phage host-nuclease inhibitor protein Gam